MLLRISIEEFMIELPEFFVRDLEEVFDIERSVTVTVFADQILIECEQLKKNLVELIPELIDSFHREELICIEILIPLLL